MADQQPTHILYHYPTSIASIMARYVYAVRGDAKGGADREVRLAEKEIKIVPPELEQLDEHYLCDINAAGEVPVLEIVDGRHMIPDSREITFYLAQLYPSLMPEDRAEEVTQLLAQIHGISFFSLTFTGKPQNQQKTKALLQSRLDGGAISDRYRAALEKKIQLVEKRIQMLDGARVEEAVSRTKELMKDVEHLLGQSRTGWVLDTPAQTAADAHLLVFICRLEDVGRGNLVPGRVKEYADMAMQTPEWQATMQGRRTVPPGGY